MPWVTILNFAMWILGKVFGKIDADEKTELAYRQFVEAMAPKFTSAAKLHKSFMDQMEELNGNRSK